MENFTFCKIRSLLLHWHPFYIIFVDFNALIFDVDQRCCLLRSLLCEERFFYNLMGMSNHQLSWQKFTWILNEEISLAGRVGIWRINAAKLVRKRSWVANSYPYPVVLFPQSVKWVTELLLSKVLIPWSVKSLLDFTSPCASASTFLPVFTQWNSVQRWINCFQYCTKHKCTQQFGNLC